MKKILICYLTLCLLSCNVNKDKDPILSDKEWESVLKQTLVLCPKDECYIYNKFGNSEMKEILKYAYLRWAEKSYYEKKESVLNQINTRINKSIINRLDTLNKLDFITDTNVNQCYIIYSEPLYVNNDKICVSLLQKRVKENSINKWVCLFNKQEGSFKMIEFYNFKEDAFYTLIK